MFESDEAEIAAELAVRDPAAFASLAATARGSLPAPKTPADADVPAEG